VAVSPPITPGSSVTEFPPLFGRHARRPRLTNTLDETTAQAILLTAPAGYGKTTLAQEWLQGRERVAWYQARPGSADLAAFSAGLADVLSPIVAGAGDRLKQRLRVADPPARAVRPLAELMAEDLAAWPPGGIIVIDDYHLVTDSSPVEEFFDWLLTLAPVRILVTTRRRPAWATARRVLYGEILELGPEQLAMTDEEASEVLGDRPVGAVRALVRQAQGWPALIGLAALSATLELPQERMSEALFRYFAEEVLRREPQDVQRFMLLASVPASISAQTARTALAIENPEPLIERLKSSDILREDRSKGLRLHPLLREFLQRRLEADDRALFEETARHFIELSLSTGRWEEAFELAIRIGDRNGAAHIIGQARADLLADGRIENLSHWLELSAPECHGVSGAVIARAHLLLQQGHISEAVAVLEDLAESLPSDHVDAARTLNLKGRALHLISDDAAAFRSHLQARSLALDPGELKEALWGLFVTANEIAPETSDRHLDELEDRFATDIDTRLRLAVGRQAFSEQRGTLAGLWPRYEALVPLVAQARDPMARSSFLANSAAVNVGRGHYDLAYSLASRALELCSDLRLDFAVGACLAFRSAAEIGLRKFSDAKRTLAQFHSSSARREDPYLQVMELTLQAKLALAQGRAHDALSTLEPLSFIDPPRRALGEYLATIAIGQAVVGETTAALRNSRRARELTGSVEAVYYSRFADDIVSLHRDASGKQRGQLTQTLTEHVMQTANAEFFDAIVVAYRAQPGILDVLRQSNVAVRVVRIAMQLANDHSLAKRLGVELIGRTEPRPIANLTPRELQVLELMSDGLSNAQIANRLFVSESTVKVHVHHILSKLEVRTRLQAVVRAAGLRKR
jgi:LuxR family transcriptional regulator, maltose regulon positive regulatory protein